MNLRKKKDIKKKIIRYVMSVSIILGVTIMAIMIFSSIKLTNYILLDSLQLTSKTASSSVSSNLHLLAERMYEISIDSVLLDKYESDDNKLAALKEKKTRIEFVWLAAYDLEGKRMYGFELAPDLLKDEKLYSHLSETNNVVIGEPSIANGITQIAVGAPLIVNNVTTGYVVGSYKYDVVNDVLSNINLGATGSAYMINEDGTIVADKKLENIGENKNVFTLYQSEKNNQVFHKILNYQTGSTTMNLNGNSYYVAYSPVEGTNWALIIDVPTNEYTNIVATALVLCIVAAIILLTAAAFIIYYFADKISNSLGIATNRLESLAEGNLTDEVVIAKTEDEAEVLTTALDVTVRRLNQYMGDIKKVLGAFSKGDYSVLIPDDFEGDFAIIRKALVSISKSLNRMMIQMNRSSSEVAENSSSITESARKLSNGSIKQTEAVERLNEGIDTITEHIDQIILSTEQVSEYAENTQKNVDQSSKQMEEMLHSMNYIYGSMEKIMEITKMIENISAQTRILSFNASIEANRAGTAGLGFSVVADEIGKLATQTANALKSTAEIVAEANKSISVGMNAANETAASLQLIQEGSVKFMEISENLEGAVNKQRDAVLHVNAEIDSVREIAETNLEVVRETDDSAKEFMNQAEELKSFVEQVKLYEDK